jgi:hypothetical protein
LEKIGFEPYLCTIYNHFADENLANRIFEPADNPLSKRQAYITSNTYSLKQCN